MAKAAIKFNLTKSMIQEIEPPESGRLQLWDAKVPGLQIVVTPTGSKSWYLYRRIDGPPVRMRLGAWPAMTVEQARNEANAMVGDIARGINPQAKRQAIRNESTLGELWEWYYETHSKPHKKHSIRDERRFNRYLAKWRNRKLSKISKSDVQALHTTIGAERGPYAANHVLELIRHMYVIAMEADESQFTLKNPAKGVRKFDRTERERFMSADELRRFFAALEQLRQTSKDFFLVALFTGARRQNVLEMRWEELDLKTGVWIVPKEKSKNKKPMSIVLVPEAMEIIQRRQGERVHDYPWVFPGQGPSGHYSEPKDAWKRTCERAGLKDLRIHDLRRTLGSWQAAGNASLIVIGKSLGHSTAAATAVYARLNLDPVRESVGAATAAMVAAGKPPAKEQ